MNARLAAIVIVFGCCAVLPGQVGDKAQFEDVIKQIIETMDSLTGTLTNIKDADSAKDAQPELRKAAGKWQTIRKKAENMAPPSKEEKDRLAKEYRPKLEQSQKKLFVEVGRVSTVPGGKEALSEITAVLEKKKEKEQDKEKDKEKEKQ